VQTDKTKESLLEVRRELADILGARPASESELAQAQAEKTLTLAGRWETSSAVLGSLTQLLRYDLPDDHWTTYADRVRALTVADVDAAARAILAPERAVWIVVGDRAKIEAGVREAGIGDVVVIDTDGEPVERP
jgi:zinc protease